MKLSYATAVVVASMLAAPVLAQQQQQQPQQQNRPATPATRPPDAPAAPVAEAPAPQPVAPAVLEAQRRRAERSVDLDELLTRVSEATGKEFLVDPRVRTQVYGVPRIDNPTYAELLTILRIHGHTAVEVGGRVNVVPDANVRFMPVRLLNRDDDNVPDDEYVMRIIATPNALFLVPILRPLMAQSGHLSAFAGAEQNNEEAKLIMLDTYANIRRMTELVNELSR